MHLDTGTLMAISDMLGTVAFSISGAVCAIERGLDLFGVLFLGVVTAIGGGVIRDTMLGVCPPVSFSDYVYLLLAVAAAGVVWTLTWLCTRGERPAHFRDDPVLNVCDAIGLGVFSVIGVQAGIAAGYEENFYFCLFLGLATGVGGGMLRDVLSCEIPFVLRKHFYAMASLIGALCYYCTHLTYPNGSVVISTLLVVALRVAAFHYRWGLPRLPVEEPERAEEPPISSV